MGRPVQYGEVFGVLQRATGETLVREIRLFPTDPLTGRRGAPADRTEVAQGALPRRSRAATGHRGGKAPAAPRRSGHEVPGPAPPRRWVSGEIGRAHV